MKRVTACPFVECRVVAYSSHKTLDSPLRKFNYQQAQQYEPHAILKSQYTNFTCVWILTYRSLSILLKSIHLACKLLLLLLQTHPRLSRHDYACVSQARTFLFCIPTYFRMLILIGNWCWGMKRVWLARLVIMWLLQNWTSKHTSLLTLYTVTVYIIHTAGSVHLIPTEQPVLEHTRIHLQL